MLTYLDGMKWNCLAQRYLYTSTTTRDFKVIYKPAVHLKITDLTWTLLFFFVVLRRCKLSLALSLLLLHLVLRVFYCIRLFHCNCLICFLLHQLGPEQKRSILSDEATDGETHRCCLTMVHFIKSNKRLHQFVSKHKCYYPFQFSWRTRGRNNLYMWLIKQLFIKTGSLGLIVDLCLRLSLASDCFCLSPRVKRMWDIHIIVF